MAIRINEIVKIGTPVVVRSYVSGVIVGRLHGGEIGAVVLIDWRWLRYWEGSGGEGSVYDLVHSDVTPSQRGPFMDTVALFSQADVMEISESCYERLAK